jgi:GT2 family glycosyltransferase
LEDVLSVRTSTALVITHNSEDVVEGCLTALAEFAPNFEVVVVDNGSSDRTVGLARRNGATVISNSENRGFAGAANQGISFTHTETVLLLNPDTWVSTPLTGLVEVCRVHGLAAGQLTDQQGVPQAGFSIRRFPTAANLILELLGVNRLWRGNPWNRKYRYLDRDLNQDGPVEQPAGAFFMIRRDVWQTLGGFDEDFWPIWFEDVDFCRRATEAGYTAQYLAGVRAKHLGGQSIKKLDSSVRELYWYVSLIKYAAKHFGASTYRGVCLAAVLSAFPRMILGMMRERGLRPLGSYCRILNFAGRRLVFRQHRVGRGTHT